jgi:hypothetical protein
MSSSKDAIHGSLVVLEAVEAARNTRAFMLFLGGVILALIVAGLLSAIGGTLASNDQHLMGALFIFFGVVAAFIIAGTGLSAAGKTLMDQIQQRAQLSVREALMVGLLTLPKLIGIWLIEVAVFVVFVIALAVVLFICKIPLLGPLLYTVVYPVASVLAGILWFTFAFIVNPLAAPALWEGYGVRQALKALGLNRDALNLGRLLPPIVQQLVLLLVVGGYSVLRRQLCCGARQRHYRLRRQYVLHVCGPWRHGDWGGQWLHHRDDHRRGHIGRAGLHLPADGVSRRHLPHLSESG